MILIMGWLWPFAKINSAEKAQVSQGVELSFDHAEYEEPLRHPSMKQFQ